MPDPDTQSDSKSSPPSSSSTVSTPSYELDYAGRFDAGSIRHQSGKRSPSEQTWIQQLADAYLPASAQKQLRDFLRGRDPVFTSEELAFLVANLPAKILDIQVDQATIGKFYATVLTIDFVIQRIRALESSVNSLNRDTTSEMLNILDVQIVSPDSRPWQCVDRYPSSHVYASDGNTNALEGQSAGSPTIIEIGGDERRSDDFSTKEEDAIAKPDAGQPGLRQKFFIERWEDEHFLLSFPVLDYITALSQGSSLIPSGDRKRKGREDGDGAAEWEPPLWTSAVADNDRKKNGFVPENGADKIAVESTGKKFTALQAVTYWSRVWKDVQVLRAYQSINSAVVSRRTLVLEPTMTSPGYLGGYLFGFGKKGNLKYVTNFANRTAMYNYINQFDAPAAKMMDAIVRCGVWAQIFQRYKNLSRQYSILRKQSAAKVNTGSVLDAFGRNGYMQVAPIQPISCPSDTYPVYYGYDGIEVPRKDATALVGGRRRVLTNIVDTGRTQCMPTAPLPSEFEAYRRRRRRRRNQDDDKTKQRPKRTRRSRRTTTGKKKKTSRSSTRGRRHSSHRKC